jgi:hypothetical protein
MVHARSAETFVRNIKPPYRLSSRVFTPLKDEPDDFVRGVLAKAREMDVKWEGSPWNWTYELDQFLSCARGIDVFREWLNIPYVQKYVEGTRVVKLSHPDREWDSCAHALAFYGLCDLVDELLQRFPEFLFRKVPYSPLFCSDNFHCFQQSHCAYESSR